jgi:hypothetical protein
MVLPLDLVPTALYMCHISQEEIQKLVGCGCFNLPRSRILHSLYWDNVLMPSMTSSRPLFALANTYASMEV